MKKRTPPFPAEVRERAVRLVLEHGSEHPTQWAAISSVAAKIGCTGETLRNWVRQAERDRGLRAGPTSAETERIKALERENRELRQANEILRKASAYFAMAVRMGPIFICCANGNGCPLTAGSSHDRLYRCPSGGLWDRADRAGSADRPIDIP